MIKKNILLFLRLIGKQKAYYFINVFGLAAGIASFLIILIYVNYEYSFDSFHENSNRIYRVVSNSSRSPVPLAQVLEGEVPGVEKATRLIFRGLDGTVTVSDSKGELFEERAYCVDSTFFEMFSYPLVQGNAKGIFRLEENLVITKRIAEKYFPGTNPVGQLLTINNISSEPKIFKVSGVIENPPPNSQFSFDILLPSTNYGAIRRYSEMWDNNLVYSFIQLSPAADPETVVQETRKAIARHSKLPIDETDAYAFQPFQELHLLNTTTFDFGPHNKKENLIVLLSVAVLILVIGSINFINLSTAKALDRVKEIGLRKTVGATKAILINQFLTESIFISCTSFLFALAIVYLVAPVFYDITGVPFVDAFNEILDKIVYIIPLPFVIGLLSGLYPAYFISSFQPIQALKGHSLTTSKSALRIVLVTVQFAITAFLLNGTSIITRQLDFINTKDLGFDREQILVMQTGSRTMGERLDPMRHELLRNPSILNVSAALTVPGEYMYNMPYSPSDVISDEETPITLSGMYVDPEFILNMGIEVIDGRSFSKEIATDTLSFLFNEEALKSFVAKYGPEWNDPIGKKLNYFRSNNEGWYVAKQGTVVGIVKDFNYESLHEPIRPLVIQVDYKLFFKILVKINPNNISETLAFLKGKWTEFNPNQPFNYYFLDQQFGKAYEREQKFETIFKVFAALSILISCLGLYGLVLFTTAKRTKEIGIRKVLGANTTSISILLAKSFIKPVVIAFLLVLPLSIIAMGKWLEQFAYHQNPDMVLFVISGAWCLSIALVTIASRTLMVSRTNPLKYLKEN